MSKKYRIWKFTTLFLVGSIVGLVADDVLAQSPLYAIDNTIPFLSVVDPATGAELSFVQIVVPGEVINSGNGLAVNPLTGDLYAAAEGWT